MSQEKVLLLGAGGQIGVELTEQLRKKFGADNVLPTDIRAEHPLLESMGRYAVVDALDTQKIKELIQEEGFTQVYLLAAVLSATGEQNPQLAWKVNMDSLLGLLEIGKELKLNKIFWPSSIAVFGPTSPKQNTPQSTVIEPSSMYGITKYAGENLCAYYNKKFDMDIRSIRYPGLISYKSPPGGGTTDYAVDIFHKAIAEGSFTSFLSEDTYLPMMFMEDAIRATIELMDAPKENLKAQGGYNLSGMSFSPKEIAAAITKHIPSFTIDYAPDFRQQIANDWPASIDDTQAQKDWNWKANYDLPAMVKAMLVGVKDTAHV